MFNLFVLGSVQKPSKSKVNYYLPDISFFSAKSHYISALIDSQNTGDDLLKFKKVAADYESNMGKGKDTIYKNEAELSGNYKLLGDMLEAYHSDDRDALSKTFDVVESKGREALRDGMPALFATMAAGYVLN